MEEHCQFVNLNQYLQDK